MIGTGALALTSDVMDALMAEDTAVRGVLVVRDSKRPRFELVETVPQTDSFKDDVAKIAEIVEKSPPDAVAVRYEGKTWCVIGIGKQAAESVNAIVPHLDVSAKRFEVGSSGDAMKVFAFLPKMPAAVDAFYGADQPAECKQSLMQQTMIRVKNPKVSLDFYTKILGFRMVHHLDYPQWGFTVFFVAYISDEQAGKVAAMSKEERTLFCFTCPACVELTWNHGSEKEEADKIYNTGNADTVGVPNGDKIKGGFGHIGITVPDVYAACDRWKALGVEFKKSPNGGGMKGLAFIYDPDGYSIEVLPQGQFVTQAVDCMGVALDGGEGYKDNSK